MESPTSREDDCVMDMHRNGPCGRCETCCRALFRRAQDFETAYMRSETELSHAREDSAKALQTLEESLREARFVIEELRHELSEAKRSRRHPSRPVRIT